jgi:hypothetical protein
VTRTRNLAVGAVFLLLGLIELVVGLVRADLIEYAGGDLASLLVGWGPFATLPNAIQWTVSHAKMVETLKSYGSAEALQSGQPHHPGHHRHRL